MMDFSLKDVIPMIREHAHWAIKPIGILAAVAALVVLLTVIAGGPIVLIGQAITLWRSPPVPFQDGSLAHPFDSQTKCPVGSIAFYDSDISQARVGAQMTSSPNVCFVRTKIHDNDKNLVIGK